MRKRSIMLTSVGAGVLALILAAPAVADPTDTTTVTFDVTAGSLDIDAPAAAYLGGGAPGDTISGELGAVAVSDTRGGATSAWVAEAYSTNFTVVGSDPLLTIPFTAVSYWSGPALADPAPTGGGTFSPGQPAVGDSDVLTGTTETAIQVFAHSGGTGGSTVSWNPTLVVEVPITAQIGLYTGTVTHQVA